MNWDIVKGKWNQVKGAAKSEWGDLTDDELTEIAGDRDKMSGKLQEKYGWSKVDAESKLDDFARRHG